MELCDPQNRASQCPAEVTRPLCHCLGVSEFEVREAIVENAIQSVRGVARACGAGSGCTACHRHIKRLLNEQIVQGRMQPLGEPGVSQQSFPSFAALEPAAR
jgi:bacterioferritin-associated ferredoxin